MVRRLVAVAALCACPSRVDGFVGVTAATTSRGSEASRKYCRDRSSIGSGALSNVAAAEARKSCYLPGRETSTWMAVAPQMTSLGADLDLQSAHLYGYGDPDHKPSILQTITAQRHRDVEAARRLTSEGELQQQIEAFEEEYGGPIDLFARIRQEEPRMAMAAEFKRASPSKGDIAPGMVAAEQGTLYASVGATVLSVLTEPKWFKGTLRDMRDIRVATQALGGNRPAVLRKDFVVDEYMVLEARANGADTVLLIVAILPVDRLKSLVAFCRAQGMEPLVEVHTDEEMAIALDAGSRVIGVNNRNLHTFELDMGTTERVARVASARGVSWGRGGDIQLAALSGIASRADVERFQDVGASMVLVGETLMRAPDPRAAVLALLGSDTAGSADTAATKAAAVTAARANAAPWGDQLVKVCGITNAADARAAAAAGANLIGVIFAERSARRVTPEAAAEVVAAVRAFGERRERKALRAPPAIKPAAAEASGTAATAAWFKGWASSLAEASRRTPLVVGVFQDQPLDEVREMADCVGLDLVQLHGDEGLEACGEVGVPAVRVVSIPAEAQGGDGGKTAEERAAAVLSQLRPGFAAAVLLDASVGSAKGGTGVTFDHEVARLVQAAGVPIILAGGLNADSVSGAVGSTGAWGVDVSSGVEQSPGVKDNSRVRDFLANARRAYSAL